MYGFTARPRLNSRRKGFAFLLSNVNFAAQKTNVVKRGYYVGMPSLGRATGKNRLVAAGKRACPPVFRVRKPGVPQIPAGRTFSSMPASPARRRLKREKTKY
jgi:hypothetical protein